MTPRIIARLPNAAALLIAIAASCWPAWSIYSTPQYVVAIATSALVGAGIALLGAIRRFSWGMLAAIGVAAFLSLVAPLAAPQRVAAGDWAGALLECLAAVVLSWRRILTVGLPVGTDDALLVAPIILVLAGSIIALTVALRSKRAELAAFVPGVIGVWGILWGPREVPAAWVTGLVGVGAIAAYVALVRQAKRRSQAPRALSSLTRRVVIGGVVAIVAGAGAAAAGSSVPLPERVVLRGEAPSSVLLQTASPLASYRSFWQDERRDATMLTVTGMEPGDRIRLVALNSYDGTVLSVDRALFQRVATQEAGEGRIIGVSVGDLTTPWIPAVGQAQGVRFVGPRSDDLAAGLHRNAQLGALAVEPELGAGDGVQYYSSQQAPMAEGAEIAALEPGDLSQAASGLPDSMLTALAAWTDEAGTRSEQLAAMVSGMRADGYVSHGGGPDEVPSRPGHALPRLDELFSDPMVGDAEQYATAAMLLASQLGFEARVVVGFTPDAIEPGVPTVVKGTDADAWIEVRTASGWVGIDVTPEPRPIPTRDAGAPSVVREPPAQQNPAPPPRGQEQGADAAPPAAPTDLDDNTAWLQTIGAAAAVFALLAVIAAIPALLVFAKFVRRRRRRRVGGPRWQALGAWTELTDRLLDRGVELPCGATRVEQAGDDVLMRSLANRVDRAVFAGAEPSPADVRSAWAESDAVLAARNRGWPARVLASLNPASIARR